MAALPQSNIDTDQIIPARFLKTTDKQGLSDKLFYDWRYDASGRGKPEFILNRPERRGVEVLVAGDNFGCGSSREHAAWALVQFGLRAVVSTSFADIFRQNALKNGLLPIVVTEDVHRELMDCADRDATAVVVIDLVSRALVLPSGKGIAFAIDEFARHCLIEGVDELAYMLSYEQAIADYERNHPAPIDTRERGA
jgi:3-isopropylmalate/(R)-2-methylmalate dehydratase small subunit